MKVTKKRHPLRIIILIALLILAGIIITEQNLSQTLLDLAYARAYSIAVETINRAVEETINQNVQYAQLMDVTFDANGNVSMLRANTVYMNELATRTAILAEENLNRAEHQTVKIPLGAALGVRFLAGFGPDISVQIIPVGAVHVSFETGFESAGINQTRHKILILLRTTVSLIVPTGSRRVEVESAVPIAESIIVGDVPDSYVDVSDQEDMLNLIP